MFEGIFGRKRGNVVLDTLEVEKLSRMGEHAKAVELCDKLIAENPNERLYYSYRGREKAKMGEMQSAIPDFEKADELDPERCPGTSMWAEFLVENGQKEEAMKIVEKRKQRLVEWEKANPGYHEAKIAEYDKKISEAPNNSKKSIYYASRGTEKAKIGDMEGAAADFEKADELEPRFSLGASSHARALSEIGRGEEALKLLERKMAERPDRERTLRVLYMKIKEGSA
jgi:predicted Zn-dependent protease